MGFFFLSLKKCITIQIFTAGGLMKKWWEARWGGVEIRNCIRQRVRGGTTHGGAWRWGDTGVWEMSKEPVHLQKGVRKEVRARGEEWWWGGWGGGWLGLRVLPDCPRGDEWGHNEVSVLRCLCRWLENNHGSGLGHRTCSAKPSRTSACPRTHAHTHARSHTHFPTKPRDGCANVWKSGWWVDLGAVTSSSRRATAPGEHLRCVGDGSNLSFIPEM